MSGSVGWTTTRPMWCVSASPQWAHGAFFLVYDEQGHFGTIPGPTTLRPMQTWTGDDGQIRPDVIGRMRRELLRAAGIAAYEPEPGGASSAG